MTGMERNSDLIVMAAYAPLLVNVSPGGMQWESDLIGYNTMNSYGSPSYYAQVMFASHLGDHTLASKLEGAGPKLFYSITSNATKKKLYLKIVNASSIPQSLEINLPGAKLAATAKLFSMTAPSTQSTNSIDDPRHIIPVETTLGAVTSKFQHKVPGYAIQVIEFNQQ